MRSPLLLEVCEPENLASVHLIPEPFGDTPYLALIEDYAGLACQKKAAGAQKLVLSGMSGLDEARAAVLGARIAALPLYVLLLVDEKTRAQDATAFLAALICLQELGIQAFGLEFECADAEIVKLYSTMRPYASVPLLACSAVAGEAEYVMLLEAGAEILCTYGQDAAWSEDARLAVARAVPKTRPPRQEDAPLLLCDATGVYYLEEDFTQSNEIECSLDMSGAILAMEETAVDALCFRIVSVGDAMELGRNAHMIRCAVCLLAGDEGSLETALALYTGRALVDARSDVEEGAMHALAKAYGAVIR